jgi:hypothetical protein
MSYNNIPCDTVSIRPGVSILSVLRHLNYKPWYALAEFVDNSIQSYLTHREALKSVEEEDYQLKVTIDYDASENGRLIVRDNAAGIFRSEYTRAFKPAEIPPDRSGLSEFGMGMKSAACWFSKNWSVRTSALGENFEGFVYFDLESIIEGNIENLDITFRQVANDSHYTEIVMTNLHIVLQGRTISKIKDHLASIYRVFTREGILKLTFNGEELVYEEPRILNAPFYNDPSGESVLWRKDISFDFGLGLSVHGFAALRETASTSKAGFALFRKNRLILGSGDDTYRPEYIFGHSNSYRYQRLFGELHLEGFEVSHTKDGFKWDDNEEVFLEILKEHLNSQPLPLLVQAEEHRVRPSRGALIQGAEQATDRTAQAIRDNVPPVLESQIIRSPEFEEPTPTEFPPTNLELNLTNRVIEVNLYNTPWQIIIETTTDPAIGDWLTIFDQTDFTDGTGRTVRRIGMRMSLAHPFMDRFCGDNLHTLEALMRLGAGICLAKTTAQDIGATMTNTIIRNLNELLRNGLDRP